MQGIAAKCNIQDTWKVYDFKVGQRGLRVCDADATGRGNAADIQGMKFYYCADSDFNVPGTRVATIGPFGYCPRPENAYKTRNYAIDHTDPGTGIPQDIVGRLTWISLTHEQTTAGSRNLILTNELITTEAALKA